MSSDDFFAQDHGLERYDLIFIDGLHEEDQCLRDLDNSLQRLSEEGFIIAHDVNPPALVRFRQAHPQVELCTFDVDWGCAVLWRCTEKSGFAWQGRLSNLDWNYFDAHRHELLSLVPASRAELRKLLGLAREERNAVGTESNSVPEQMQIYLHLPILCR
jgi:hypothetical protein